MKAPNGWISHDLLIWNELDRRGFVSAGFVLDVPDLRHASERALDGFYESVRQFLHTLEESTRAQIRWSVDSNYRDTLLAYKTVTDERCDPDSWAAIARNERFNRYWRAMQAGQLRREKLVLFLSKRIAVDPPAASSRGTLTAHYQSILTQYREALDQHGRIIAPLFEPHGGSVSSMSCEDLFRYYAIFFNPSSCGATTTIRSGSSARRKPSIKTAGIRAYRQGKPSGSFPTVSITTLSSSSAARSGPGVGSSGR